jgi:sulfide dehydrogenase [flavocytochrome c] flavoprotein subunit
VKRRTVLKLLSSTAALGFAGVWPLPSRAQTRGTVVVVGGGFGGATAARYLRLIDPSLHVTLVEPARQFITCPMSNDYIAGERDFESLVRSYAPLRAQNVNVVHDTVTRIDPRARRVFLRGGNPLPYDRLIVSPGIDFQWGAIAGYDEVASRRLPHAWKAGDQSRLLHDQLLAMPDAGTVIISVPASPYRCPPGPYERVSLIAHYLLTYKRRAKILVLDAKNEFIKQALFQEGWAELYPRGMIEWVPLDKGGRVTAVDPQAMTVTSDGGVHRGDVINLIAPHRAGALAHASGLADSTGWCPVNPRSFESTLHPNIHVIGDACIAGAMPKSGVSANTQAKVAAQAIVDLLNDRAPQPPSFLNACFSLIGPSWGISVAGVYEVGKDNTIVAVKDAGGVSPLKASLRHRRLESIFWNSWYENIIADSFG